MAACAGVPTALCSLAGALHTSLAQLHPPAADDELPRKVAVSAGGEGSPTHAAGSSRNVPMSGRPIPLGDAAVLEAVLMDTAPLPPRALIPLLDPTSDLSEHTDDMIWSVSSLPQHDQPTTNTNTTTTTGTGTKDTTTTTSVGNEVLARMAALHLSVVRRPSRRQTSGASPPRADEEDENLSRARDQKALSLLQTSLPHGAELKLFATALVNIVVQWKYTLTVAVVRPLFLPESAGNGTVMVAYRQITKPMYASPHKAFVHHRAPSSSGGGAAAEGPILSFPTMCFNVDDFDSQFDVVRIGPGYHLAVLLTAGESRDANTAGVFRGVVPYADMMKHLRRKYRAPIAPTGPASGSSSPGGGMTDGGQSLDDCVYVPLAAKAGRSELAISVAPSDRKYRKQAAKLDVVKDAGKRLVRIFSSSSLKQTADSGRSPVEEERRKAPNSDESMLDGDELLNCALTFLAVQIGHVTSVLMDGVGDHLNLAGGVSGPSNTDHQQQQQQQQPPMKPWLLVPSSKDQLQTWVEHDATFREAKRRAAAATAVQSSS